MPARKGVDTSHLTLDQIFVPGSAPSTDNRPDHALETKPNLPPEPDWTNAGFTFEVNQAEEFSKRLNHLSLPPSELRNVDEMFAAMGIHHPMVVDGKEEEEEGEDEEEEEEEGEDEDGEEEDGEDEDGEDEDQEDEESGEAAFPKMDDAFLDEMDEEEAIRIEFDQSEGVDLAITESKLDTQLKDFCLKFTQSQSQKDEFKNFVGKYRIPVVECMVMNINLKNSPMYRLDEDGWVIRAFDWYSALGNCYMEIIEIPEIDLFCERFLIPLFVAYKQNPHLEHIFKARRDLSSHRYLLELSKTSSVNLDQPGIYTMHPPWQGVATAIRNYEESGLIAYLATDPMTTPAYLGMTKSMQKRVRHHVNKPVNSRVVAVKKDIPMSKWKHTMVAKFDGDEDVIPHVAMHIVEHVLFGMFKITDQDLGGLNVNPVDRFHFLILVPATKVIRMLKVVDKLLELHPERLLPRYGDFEAWPYFLQPLLPDGCPVTGKTLREYLKGISRKYIFKKAKPKHLIEYWNRMDDPLKVLPFLQRYGADVPVKPATESFLFASEFPQTSKLIGTDPIQELDSLRQLVQGIAEEIPEESRY
ncbi:hypothetical protein V866_005401 [Kwoniella sp. B9012]